MLAPIKNIYKLTDVHMYLRTRWNGMDKTGMDHGTVFVYVYICIYIYAAHLYVCTFSDPELRIHYIRIALRVYIYISSYVLTCMYTYT